MRLDGPDDHIRDVAACDRRIRIDFSLDPFPAVEDSLGKVFFDKAAFARQGEVLHILF